jgi:hypothetical protein
MKTKFLFLLLAPLMAFGQTFSAHEQFETGDSVLYTIVANGKTKPLEYQYTKTDKNQIAGKVIFDGREGEFNSPGVGFEAQDFGLTNGEMIIRKPAVKIFEPAMQIGAKWTNFYEAVGENFKAQITQQAVVEKYEKVKLKFGEVDCFVVVTNDVLQVLTAKSEVISGKSSGKLWVGVVNNRLLIVKRDYQNSFGAKMVQELSEPPKVSDSQKKLEKLKELHKGGLINDSEYEQKKKEILKTL